MLKPGLDRGIISIAHRIIIPRKLIGSIRRLSRGIGRLNGGKGIRILIRFWESRLKGPRLELGNIILEKAKSKLKRILKKWVREGIGISFLSEN